MPPINFDADPNKPQTRRILVVSDLIAAGIAVLWDQVYGQKTTVLRVAIPAGVGITARLVAPNAKAEQLLGLVMGGIAAYFAKMNVPQTLVSNTSIALIAKMIIEQLDFLTDYALIPVRN